MATRVRIRYPRYVSYCQVWFLKLEHQLVNRIAELQILQYNYSLTHYWTSPFTFRGLSLQIFTKWDLFLIGTRSAYSGILSILVGCFKSWDHFQPIRSLKFKHWVNWGWIFLIGWGLGINSNQAFLENFINWWKSVFCTKRCNGWIT